MRKKNDNNNIDRNRFIKVFGFGFVTSVFTKSPVTGIADIMNGSDDNKTDRKIPLEPQPNVLSVSRQKNH